jgi:hypothetical protein
MRADDFKFLASFAATIILAGVVIYSAYLRDLRTAAGPTVDLERIEAVEKQGVISLREASHWEPVEEEAK